MRERNTEPTAAEQPCEAIPPTFRSVPQGEYLKRDRLFSGKAAGIFHSGPMNFSDKSVGGLGDAVRCVSAWLTVPGAVKKTTTTN